MNGRRALKEDLELKKARRKIRKIQENESCTGGTSGKIKLDKRMHRNVKCIGEPESGYWNCGGMKYACQFCLALRFLGEKIVKKDLRWQTLDFRSSVLAAKLHHTFF